MMKRNEGYALSYVLIVMLVLAAISMGVMTLALQVMKNQQASIKRMQDKYAAQGMIEQVVAELEHAVNDSEAANVIAGYARNDEHPDLNPYCIPDDTNPKKCTIYAVYEKNTVTAEIMWEQITTTEDTGEVDENNNPITTTSVIGYTVTYLSYNTEVAP